MSKNKVQFTTSVLSDMSVEKLYEQILVLCKEFFNLRVQKSLGDLKNTSRFVKVKKNIARLNTELSKRKREVNHA